MNTLTTCKISPIQINNVKTKSQRNNTKKSATLPPIKNNLNDYLTKAERINGRAAMIGFTSAVLDEYVTGNSISTQFAENIGISVATIGLVILGTASNPKDEGESRIKSFNRNAETINGRLAMVGIASLLLAESIHPQIPLF